MALLLHLWKLLPLGRTLNIKKIGMMLAEIASIFIFLAFLRSSSILGRLGSKYLGQLNSYLDPVRQNRYRSRFVRCWHANTDGWAASTFHSNCDGKGPTVTIVQVGSYIFGGYTDKSWGGKCRLIILKHV